MPKSLPSFLMGGSSYYHKKWLTRVLIPCYNSNIKLFCSLPYDTFVEGKRKSHGRLKQNPQTADRTQAARLHGDAA